MKPSIGANYLVTVAPIGKRYIHGATNVDTIPACANLAKLTFPLSLLIETCKIGFKQLRVDRSAINLGGFEIKPVPMSLLDYSSGKTQSEETDIERRLVRLVSVAKC